MRMTLRPLELALRVASAVSAAFAVLWVLGVNGLGQVSSGQAPRWLQSWLEDGDRGSWASNVVTPVSLSRGDDQHRLYQLFDSLNGERVGHVLIAPPDWAEIQPAAQVQLFDPTAAQRIALVGLHVLLCLAVAYVWWALARMVADSRSSTPFTAGNAARLQRIGLLLLLGGTASALVRWAILSWMVETSSIRDAVTGPSFGVHAIPWWTVGIGASVLVVSAVWRRGVALQDDVRGLV